MTRRKDKQTLVLKLGSSTLTKGTNQISRGKIEDIARQILSLKETYDIVLVSSGAIAAARQFLELSGANRIAVKQALAAIGQPQLMRIYQEVFQDFGLRSAQCLLNYRDFENTRSRQNTMNTIRVLLHNDYIPVINENDTVATEEIMFGDNDKLAALAAALLKADLLVLASDVNGLYSDDPRNNANAMLLPTVHKVSDVIHLGRESTSLQGTGGMKSKLMAAEICAKHGVEMWIINGWQDNFMVHALDGKVTFTRFLNKK